MMGIRIMWTGKYGLDKAPMMATSLRRDKEDGDRLATEASEQKVQGRYQLVSVRVSYWFAGLP